MILHCNKTNKPVAVIIDGVAYINDLFCHSKHVVNVATIKVCNNVFNQKISELE